MLCFSAPNNHQNRSKNLIPAIKNDLVIAAKPIAVGRLKFANRASRPRISGIFLQKFGVWPSWNLQVEAVFPRERISGEKFQKIGLASFTLPHFKGVRG